MKPDWKQVLIAFVVGALLGGLLAVRCAPRGFFHHHMMNNMTSQLRLNTDQREKVAAVSESARQKVSLLRQEIRPRFEEIRAFSRAEIRKVLTSDQQARFDEMTARMDARLEKRRAEWRKKPYPMGF